MATLNNRFFFVIIIPIIFLATGHIALSSKKPDLKISKQTSALNFNQDFLPYISLGQKRLLANSIWITTLIQSDQSHYKKKDSQSWMSLRFQSISQLDPYFLKNYQFGARYLSIIKDDPTGAMALLEKGFIFFPDDYELLFQGGFIYVFELKNFQKGLQLYKRLQQNHRIPSYLKGLILKLKYQNGDDYQSVFKALQIRLLQESSPELKQKIYADLYALKAQYDLKCLNQGEDNCDLKDLDGHEYFRENKVYRARKEFGHYNIKVR